MKGLVIYRWTIVFIIAVQLIGCIDDDEVDFPDVLHTNIESSNALVSVLNNIAQEIDVTNDRQCFSFKYPIVLGYNNESNITIETYDGLVNVISSQTSNFNITGLAFPIEIIFNDDSEVLKVDNENEMFSLLERCNYTTLRNEFDRLFKQCFTFDYPIILFDNDRTEVRLASDEEFDTFYNLQPADYQPDFQFPFTVFVGVESTPVPINSIFDFYTITNECLGCPEIQFNVTRINPNTFDFDPNFVVRQNYELFWIIDGEILNVDAWSGNWDNDSLLRQFEPGSHTICIKAITPDCPLGTEICKDVVAESVCPDLFFTGNQEPESFIYDFVADFNQIQTTRYEWFVDNVFIEDDGAGVQNADNQLTYNFETPGTYEVCIKSESSFCPEGTSFCETIVLDPICPEMTLIIDPMGGNRYFFFPEITSIEPIEVILWSIDGGAEQSRPSTEGFEFEFPASGTYTVCARIEGTNICPNGIQVCEEIVIP